MSFIATQPPGVFVDTTAGRKPIIKVVGGDSCVIDALLYDPLTGSPATPDNTLVKVVLSETQFDDPIWCGAWYSGITMDKNRSGLCHIVIPREITTSLRRGSYQFSVRVSDLLKSTYRTEAEGSILVEYQPTGEQHSIPYKDDYHEVDPTLYDDGDEMAFP